MKKLYSAQEFDNIEAFDIDFGYEKAVGIVRSSETKQLMLHLWRKPEIEFLENDETPDVMTRLERLFPLLSSYVKDNENFLESKCKCLSVQLRYPICLAFFSNAFGYFEYFEDRGRPYSLFGFYDVNTETCLRTITINDTWMHKHNIVPYDYDSGLLSCKFNCDRLIVGFGSFSDRNDGGIAMWDMKEILNPDVEEDNLQVTKLPAPCYHWRSADGHTGGVHALHLDKYQLLAVNACVHQVATRCIEGGDETKKDNVILYDFWKVGIDNRREQRK